MFVRLDLQGGVVLLAGGGKQRVGFPALFRLGLIGKRSALHHIGPRNQPRQLVWHVIGFKLNDLIVVAGKQVCFGEQVDACRALFDVAYGTSDQTFCG